jgi:hypothetical protein
MYDVKSLEVLTFSFTDVRTRDNKEVTDFEASTAKLRSLHTQVHCWHLSARVYGVISHNTSNSNINYFYILQYLGGGDAVAYMVGTKRVGREFEFRRGH